VSGRANWSYVQARLQARHGERLEEADWRMLEAAKSLDHFHDRARMSSLRRCTERIDPQMSPHAIERALRAEWRRYVAEVAAWVPSEWQAPVLWTEHVPDLPLMEGFLGKPAPEWAREDPVRRWFPDDESPSELPVQVRAPVAPLLATNDGTLAYRWLAHWRTLWPRRRTVERERLDGFCAVVADHLARLAEAGPQDTSRPYRLALARTCERMFRRHSGTPTAVFAHLVLVALDFERLRGGFVRRQLFQGAAKRKGA
jgi:hypothetical protein